MDQNEIFQAIKDYADKKISLDELINCDFLYFRTHHTIVDAEVLEAFCHAVYTYARRFENDDNYPEAIVCYDAVVTTISLSCAVEIPGELMTMMVESRKKIAELNYEIGAYWASFTAWSGLRRMFSDTKYYKNKQIEAFRKQFFSLAQWLWSRHYCICGGNLLYYY